MDSCARIPRAIAASDNALFAHYFFSSGGRNSDSHGLCGNGMRSQLGGRIDEIVLLDKFARMESHDGRFSRSSWTAKTLFDPHHVRRRRCLQATHPSHYFKSID